MQCSWGWAAQALGVAACGAAFWWTIRFSVRDAAANKQRPNAVTARVYVARRVQLQNARGLRAAQLCAGILYSAVMAYVYLIVSPTTLTTAHVFGLLLSNLHILVTCCCTVAGLVPFCEKLLLEYNPVVSAVSTGSLALVTNLSVATGLAVHNSFICNILAYDVLWLLEDCPLPAYLPLHLAVLALHFATQRCLPSTTWSLLQSLLAYLGLGVLLPVVASGVLLPSNSQARVPAVLHTILAATVIGYLLLDQLLRAPLLTEPLQAAAAEGGSLLLRGVVSLLEPSPQPAAGAVSGEGAGGGGTGGSGGHRYGLAEKTGLSIMWSTLALTVASAVLAGLSEGEGGTLQGLANKGLLASLSKNSAASYLFSLLRGMPACKKYTVLGIAATLCLQLLGMVSVVCGVAVHGPEHLVRTAPTVLLGVMLGCVVQVVGVLYILLGHSEGDGMGALRPEAGAGAAAGGGGVGEGGVAAGGGGGGGMITGRGSLEMTTAPATVTMSEAGTVSRSTSVGGGTTPLTHGSRSLLTRANVLAQDNLMEGAIGESVSSSGQQLTMMGGPGGLDSYSMMSGLSRGPSERLSHVSTLDAVEDLALDLRNRIEALGNFKTFMQGLDQQPGVYSLEEFIRGAATAIRGIFPGVAHASFCLLNQTRNCVNMYTFLGDGSRKPPRINVTVAPGTLIYHVLHNCQPVFISNVAAFPGPYADVQFMRFVLSLRSVACLPLVVAGSRVLGVLRLGFEELWNWTEQEKGIAKQLALVLSSTSTGMHVYGGGAGGGGGGAGGQQASAPPGAPSSGAAAAAAAAAAAGNNTGTTVGSSGSGAFDSQQSHAAAAAAAATALAAVKAGYPNVASMLTANSSGAGPVGHYRSGGAAHSRRQDDSALAFAHTLPLGAPLQPQQLLPHNPHPPQQQQQQYQQQQQQQYSYQQQQQQMYGTGGMGGGSGIIVGPGPGPGPGGGGGGSGSGGHSGGMASAVGGGGSGGAIRRMRQASRSSLHYVTGPYSAGPGSSSGGGLDSGANVLSTGAHTLLATGGSSRSSVDHHVYHAAAAVAAGGGGGGVGPMGHHSHMPYSASDTPGTGSFGAAAAAAAATGGMGLDMGMGRGSYAGTGGGGGVGGVGMVVGGGYGSIFGGGVVGMPSHANIHNTHNNHLSGSTGQPGRLAPSNSGSGQQLQSSELDETWLLQQPGSAQVRRALARPAQAQGQCGGAGADLKMLEVIGRGGFGSVYKAFWRGMVVAVKVLEHEDEMLPCSGSSGSAAKVDTSSRRAALLEGAMTSTISHPHVVQTYDYRVVHLDPQSSLNGITRSRVLHETHIIMEFCDRGSLQDAIEQGVFVADPDGPRGARSATAEPEVDMELIIMTLAEVSTAMEYLHKHRITHRDLKPKNILLRSSNKDRRGYVSKVSDFGLSQVLPDTNKTQVSTKYSGTVTHMAPELIEDGKVYQQGDVYAFGIIMWEIYTSATPYQNMAHPQIMVGVVTHNLRPKFPASCPDWYRGLAHRCWRKDPKSRPPFAEVTQALLALLPDKDWKPAD